MSKVKILCCCGTGIATSTVANDAISKICKKNGIDFTLQQGKILEIPSKLGTFQPDVILATTTVSCDTKGVPVISGLPFLTGIGLDKLEKDFLKAVGYDLEATTK